jgi:hypothetical protein
MLSTKRRALINIKNIPGWSTKRKIVVFSVDDYGNIRMASQQARKNLEKAGLNVNQNRFDQFDCLEDKADLEQLYETLSSVKDQHGNPAVFTAFSLPANIDFQKIKQADYKTYHYELLPDTFKRLPGYEGTWDLWKEGMDKKLLFPQSHGREHVNINFLMGELEKKNPEVLACFNEESLAALSITDDRIMSYERAFAFHDIAENKKLEAIAIDGLKQFEKVFGFKAQHFTAPGIYAHHTLEEALATEGIKYIDTSVYKTEHQGNGKFIKKYHKLGELNKAGQSYILRNCVFEPLMNPSEDHINECLAEIDIAFRWNKPANISTHRVNFCGHIDPQNREFGLKRLRLLLEQIVKKWPDAEFMTTVELGALINKN